MKVQEVILKAVAGSLKWWEAAEIIGRMVKILECMVREACADPADWLRRELGIKLRSMSYSPLLFALWVRECLCLSSGG